MTDLLHSNMILAAILPPPTEASLNSKSDAVYQCAKRSMTVGETVTETKWTHSEVEQIICELVARKLVTVRAPSIRPAMVPEETDALEEFYKSANHADYYELLGVDPDTPRSEMRTRYFELSKRYHPDKVSSSVSKAQRDKMSFIFQRLTVAYDVLSNPKRKAEYNASIAETLELRSMEKKLKAAIDRKSSDSAPSSPGQGQQENDAGFASGTPPAKDPKSNASAPGRVSRDKFTPSIPLKESDNARREALKRKRAEQAVADLLRRRSDSPTPPPDEMVESLLRDAELAMSQDRIADAQAICKKILILCPTHAGATEILKQAAEQQAKAQAQMHIRRARYAVREGQIKEAKWHLEQAAAVDKTNAEARHLLAEILLQNERDFFAALAAMKEVIVLGGQKARYFSTLGDIFLEMKEMDRAADAYNKALRMEPENNELKKKLKLCKR